MKTIKNRNSNNFFKLIKETNMRGILVWDARISRRRDRPESTKWKIMRRNRYIEKKILSQKESKGIAIYVEELIKRYT